MTLLEELKEEVASYTEPTCYTPTRPLLNCVDETGGVFDSILISCLEFNEQMNTNDEGALEPFLKPIDTRQEDFKMKIKDFQSKDDFYLWNKNTLKKTNRIISTNNLILRDFENGIVKSSFYKNGNNIYDFLDNKIFTGNIILSDKRTFNHDNTTSSDDETCVCEETEKENKKLIVKSKTSKFLVDFTSKKYRFCKNKTIKRIEMNMFQHNKNIDVDDNYSVKLRRRFSSMEFCTVNRTLSFSVIFEILIHLNIKPYNFIECRILAFYNQDISARDLSHDLITYSIIYGLENLNLTNLYTYLKDCIAEQYGDWDCVELYYTIKYLSVLDRKGRNSIGLHQTLDPIYHFMKMSLNTKIPENGMKNCITFFNESNDMSDDVEDKIKIFINKSINDVNGYNKLNKLYKIVMEYHTRSIHIHEEYLQRLLHDCKVEKKDSIGFAILLERMNLPLIPGLINYYNKALKEISHKFCKALNAMLKKGKIYQIYDIFLPFEIYKNYTNDKLIHSTYFRNHMYRSIEGIYCRRIRKCKIENRLSIIYGSAKEFQNYFGFSNLIENSFKLAFPRKIAEDIVEWRDCDRR